MEWLAEWASAIWAALVASATAAFTGFMWLFTLAAQVKTTMSDVQRLELQAEKDRASNNELLRELRDDVKWLMKHQRGGA